MNDKVLEIIQRNARDNRVASETAARLGKKLSSIEHTVHLYKLIEDLVKELRK